MQVSYGPPGHKGVTTLMAVGASELEQSQADAALSRGITISFAAFVVGALVGSTMLKAMAAGSWIGLFGAKLASGAYGSKVQVTQAGPAAPAPSGSYHW
jgi:hypothetical protein